MKKKKAFYWEIIIKIIVKSKIYGKMLAIELPGFFPVQQNYFSC